ncbi:MAG: family 10 glycosylhydrolase [Acidobacteriota bacterium]
MKKIFYCLFAILMTSALLFSQTYPKQELRGVWIASLGIDWPSTRGTSASDIKSQKDQLVSTFDQHKSYGMNAMFFHVRPKADAIYKNSIGEPWSKYLTGQEGAAPSDPTYDPLQFAIQEAHKRAMELHAWINPYRVNMSGDDPVFGSTSIALRHPEWIIKCNGSEYRFLNPGLPEVRKYLLSVIMDIVRRYDVDGIHFDDYFYPYTEYGTFNDDATFASYKGTFTDKTAWRMNNVNMLLAEINDSIKTVKPWVKFGISPAGGPSVNLSIFCDTFGWLKGNYTDESGVSHTGTSYIDYIMPQLYSANYGGLLPTWSGASTLNGRHLYVGAPAYRYSSYGANEIGWEMRANRNTPTVKGEVYFSSQSVTGNYAGCADSLVHNYYLYPAVTPKMEWLPGSTTRPNAPVNLRAEKNSVTGKYDLKWDAPAKATDGDTAFSYIVYRFESQPTAEMLKDASKILATYGTTTLPSTVAKYSVTSGDYYVVTALDRYSNESVMSNVLHQSMPDQIPQAPVLTSPPNYYPKTNTFATLKWQSAPLAESYVVQIATDSLFSDIVFTAPEHKSLSFYFSSVAAGQTYYWRVKSAGQGGLSAYSQFMSFVSGIPMKPVLLAPAHATTNVSLSPKFSWQKDPKATEYQFQLSTASTMTSQIVLDTVVTDTAFTISRVLALNKKHYWHVRARNTLGTGEWSSTFGFQTTAVNDVKEEKKEQVVREYSLKQNFPNPFNPSTVIRYSIAKEGYVRLSVFDVLGKEIAVLVDRNQNAGSYSADFNSNQLNIPSGIYFYTLRTGSFVSTRKMIIIK